MIRRIPRVKELEEDKRCAKHEEALANKKIVEEEENEEFTSSAEEVHATKKVELPFQDVLADQRRKYSPTQKYVQLMYNDLVKIIVKKWEGTFLRKTVIPMESHDPFPAENEKDNKMETTGDDVEAMNDKKWAFPDWQPDEMVKVVFDNGNTYTGRVSKKKMEGHGIYRWHHGSQYKGEFEDNKIQGKGTLEWQDCITYEGNLENGYYHGKGTMVDKNYNLLYIGEWKKGHKHGKGYCRYGENDSYNGDWVMDKREGVGKRLYPNGARYVGDWKNNQRHGKGTMIWANGDCYRGEWNQGQMHGYGKYTWNKSSKRTFCWPQEICYIGQWHQSTRNGKGNNGDITEADSLFENGILQPIPISTDFPKEDKEKNHSEGIHDSSHLNKFIKKPIKIPEPRMTSVLKPEQCPSLSYYVDRLRKKHTTSVFNIPLPPGKCNKCEEISCCCLRQPIEQSSHNQDHLSRSLSKESTLKTISDSAISPSDRNQRNDNDPTSIVKNNDDDCVQLEEEKRWAYECIAMHMPRIRKIYEMYSKIFCNESPKCRLSMTRLSLWQLWRNCRIRNLSLVQIDKYLAANGSTLMEDPHCPYERIQIWQLVHALLEVSWHLYTKNEDINEGLYPGRLANGLHKFLVNDIYPNFGNRTGVMFGPERDLLPIQSVYQLYKSIGKCHTTRQLLKAIFPTEGTSKAESYESSVFVTPNLNPEIRNPITEEENLNYLSSGEPMLRPKPIYQVEERNNLSTQSLLPLRKLGATEFIQIMSITCPSIKDPESNIIINLEYELTFLEFLEIFIESGKRFVSKKNEQREADRKKSEAAETISEINSTRGNRTSRSVIRGSEGSATTKSRKKLVKKY